MGDFGWKGGVELVLQVAVCNAATPRDYLGVFCLSVKRAAHAMAALLM